MNITWQKIIAIIILIMLFIAGSLFIYSIFNSSYENINSLAMF